MSAIRPTIRLRRMAIGFFSDMMANSRSCSAREAMRTYLEIGLAILLASGAGAADFDQAKQSATAERTANSMRDKIRAEVKSLGEHEWAGEYYAGDGLGVNTSLAIAPKSGYVFEWHGCLGLYDRNYGAVAWTNGRVRPSFTYKNER